MGLSIAIVGATGAVGSEMLALLDERNFPVQKLRLLASKRSAGRDIGYRGAKIPVDTLTEDSFANVDLALFSAGGSVSKVYAPAATRAGALVVDNTSAFRMDNDVPLVVPEVNADAALECPRGIIANPNCSTIQMVVALAPLHREAGLRRIVVSTYQAVSGAGQKAIEELREQSAAWLAGIEPSPAPQVFTKKIAGECLPRIGDFLEDGSTVEEEKMIRETQKIFSQPDVKVSATTVRVPVARGHSESINAEFTRPISAERARDLLKEAPGVEVVDDPLQDRYPLVAQAAGQDPVYVGRIRRDQSVPHGLNLWVVADNLRKGAALNAIQIAEFLLERGALKTK